MSRGDLRGGAGVVGSSDATTLAGVTPTAAGLALLDDATAADQRVTLGLVIGTDVPSLNGSALVVQNPANATATPTASKIPIADGSGKLDGWVSSASTSTAGVVQLATSGETSGSKAVTGTDSRLSDTRTPSAHASSHAPGGSDPVALPSAVEGGVYGTGRDGTVTFDGTSAVTIDGASITPSGGVYTLTRTVEASTSTISGCTIRTLGNFFRCSGTLTTTGTVTVHDNGNAASGITAGTFLPNYDGMTARTATAGGNGGGGGGANGSSGINQSSMGYGGGGGNGGNSSGHAGGTGGTCTHGALTEGWYGMYFWDHGWGRRNNSGTPQVMGLECGSGGGGGGSESGGFGGGGGGGGGLVFMAAKAIVIASGTLTISATGGAGGNGTTAAGGGGGGGGGLVHVVCNTCTGSPTLSAAGGAGGTKSGVGHSDGANGSAGHTRLVVGTSNTET